MEGGSCAAVMAFIGVFVGAGAAIETALGVLAGYGGHFRCPDGFGITRAQPSGLVCQAAKNIKTARGNGDDSPSDAVSYTHLTLPTI